VWFQTILLAIGQVSSSASDQGGQDVGWVQILLTIVGPAGLIGSFVALFKLKPDANSQSVVQAQGAAAEWQKIAAERLRERDAAIERAMRAEAHAEALEEQLEECRRLHQRRRSSS
jgi:hypothetical protein